MTQKQIDKEFHHFYKLPYSLQFQIVSKFLKQDKKNWSYFKWLLHLWIEEKENANKL